MWKINDMHWPVDSKEREREKIQITIMIQII